MDSCRDGECRRSILIKFHARPNNPIMVKARSVTTLKKKSCTSSSATKRTPKSIKESSPAPSTPKRNGKLLSSKKKNRGHTQSPDDTRNTEKSTPRSSTSSLSTKSSTPGSLGSLQKVTRRLNLNTTDDASSPRPKKKKKKNQKGDDAVTKTIPEVNAINWKDEDALDRALICHKDGEGLDELSYSEKIGRLCSHYSPSQLTILYTVTAVELGSAWKSLTLKKLTTRLLVTKALIDLLVEHANMDMEPPFIDLSKDWTSEDTKVAK